LDGDVLSVTSFVINGVATAAGTTADIPGVGKLLINSDGSFTFTPLPGYGGDIPSATYTVTDGFFSSTATLSFAPLPPVPEVGQNEVVEPKPITRTLVTATDPALYVLREVGGSARAQSLVITGVPDGDFDLHTRFEAQGAEGLQVSIEQGLGEDDVKIMIRGIGFGEIIKVTPAAPLREAMRGGSLTFDHALFVHQAVVASELNAEIANVAVNALRNAGGLTISIDWFGVGNPWSVVLSLSERIAADSPADASDRTVEVAQQPAAEAAPDALAALELKDKKAKELAAALQAQRDALVAQRNQLEGKRIETAPPKGFKAQLMALANSRQTGDTNRPLTRSVTR
jgi:hypothetical protein